MLIYKCKTYTQFNHKFPHPIGFISSLLRNHQFHISPCQRATKEIQLRVYTDKRVLNFDKLSTTSNLSHPSASQFNNLAILIEVAFFPNQILSKTKSSSVVESQARKLKCKLISNSGKSHSSHCHTSFAAAAFLYPSSSKVLTSPSNQENVILKLLLSINYSISSTFRARTQF